MKSKQFAVLVVVAFVGGIVGGFVSDQVGSIGQAFAKDGKKIIEANEFRVVDDNGKERASFGMKENNKKQVPELEIIDGKNRTRLFPHGVYTTGEKTGTKFSNDGLTIFEFNESGEIKAEIMRVGRSGPMDLVSGEYMGPPSVILRDSFYRDRLIISFVETGEPYIELLDSENNSRAVLGMTKLINKSTGSTEIRAESSLVLFNEKGNVLWSAP